MHSHDYDTLVEAQMGLRKNGFTEEFVWEDEQFKSEDKSVTYRPDDLKIVEHYRFEGASDPGDMSILMALEAKDGRKGYAISAYGTYADEKFVKFLDEIPEREDPEVTAKPA